VKELEDHSWFPSTLRNFQTEFIGFVVARFNVYEGFVQRFKAAPPPVQTMTDLCSGSGEPAISIFRKSNCFTHLFLGDKFPNDLKIQDARISYDKQSKDVLEMEFQSGTCYTMFNALHHFSDEDKLKIVHNIRKSGSPAFFVEILEPDIFCLLKVFLTTTVGSLLFTPFIRPFSFRRLFFTYILPVNLLSITFDGILSVLKSRSARQYQHLFSLFGDTIEVVRLNKGLTPLIVVQIHART
jgi:hypothetical protein